MEKIYKYIKKPLMAIIISVAVICLSLFLQEQTRDLFTIKYHQMLKLLGVICSIFATIEIVYGASKLLRKFYVHDADKLLRNITNDARANIIHYIEDLKDIDVPQVLIMSHLMFVYHYDREIFSLILEKLIITYNMNDKTKDSIVFVLLQSIHYNEVAAIFHENPKMRQECEEISREISASIDGYDVKNKGLSESLFVGLLHSCLTGNTISRDRAYILHFILGWILRNISERNINEYREIMLTFLLALPLIKEKVNNSNIHDGGIRDALENIRDLEWVDKLVEESYIYIKERLDKDQVENWEIENYIKHTCVLCTYHDKLSTPNLKKLITSIKDKNRQIHDYLEYRDDKALLVVLSASPLQMFETEDALIDEIASIVCLCICQFAPNV